MATLNWPGFGIAEITWSLDRPAQVSRSGYTGVRAVQSNPWHGKWSATVKLATQQGDAAFRAVRSFLTQLDGQVNTFHLPATEAAQNNNSGVTVQTTAAQGASAVTLTGITTALVAGNMITINGQLLALTSVGTLASGAQTVNFKPLLRAAATAGTAAYTARPYALVALNDSSISWDIATWRRYGVTFAADEAIGDTDGADPAADVLDYTYTGSSGSGGSALAPTLPSYISRSLLAAVSSPSDKQVAYLTEAGREGVFVFSTANLSSEVSIDTNQGVYVPPTGGNGSTGAWVRKTQVVTAAHFGAKGDGVTDDSGALQALSNWFFNKIRTDYVADFGGNFAVASAVHIGPTSTLTIGGACWMVQGDCFLQATAAITEICELRYFRNVIWRGRLNISGTGGAAYNTRTCGIGLRLTDCANSRIDGIYVKCTQHHGIFAESTVSLFDDQMHIGTIVCSFCGSSVNASGMAVTANWSAPVNSASYSGDFGQYTTLTVDTMPPTLLDSYVTYGQAQVLVVINGEPYQIRAINRAASTINIYRVLDLDIAGQGSGTLTYIFGASYNPAGGDSGIISVDKLVATDCGVGLGDAALYGSRIGSAQVTSCGVAIGIGNAQANAHIGTSADAFYTESCTFDLVCFSSGGSTSAYNYLLSAYALDITKCWCLADPRLSTNGYGGNAGGFGQHGFGGGLTLAHQGRLLSWLQRGLENPEVSPVNFYYQREAPYPRFFTGNTFTVNLTNQADGRFNRLFGYRGTNIFFKGTGTNNAPTGTMTFTPPTKAFTGCGTTNTSTTVSVPDTHGMVAGMPITGTGIPGSTTIATVNSRFQITLSQAATATGTATLTVTGSVNGTFGNVSFSTFDNIAGFQVLHTDAYELQWSVTTICGQDRQGLAALGYATGSGGTVTQATSKSTGVTLSKMSGQITMNAAVLAANTVVSFTLTNTNIAATDILVLNHVSGGTAGAYTLNAQCAAGSASINVRNVSAGSLSEVIVIGFALVKAVTA